MASIDGDFIEIQVVSSDYKKEYPYHLSMAEYLGDSLYYTISRLDDFDDFKPPEEPYHLLSPYLGGKSNYGYAATSTDYKQEYPYDLSMSECLCDSSYYMLSRPDEFDYFKPDNSYDLLSPYLGDKSNYGYAAISSDYNQEYPYNLSMAECLGDSLYNAIFGLDEFDDFKPDDPYDLLSAYSGDKSNYGYAVTSTDYNQEYPYNLSMAECLGESLYNAIFGLDESDDFKPDDPCDLLSAYLGDESNNGYAVAQLQQKDSDNLHMAKCLGERFDKLVSGVDDDDHKALVSAMKPSCGSVNAALEKEERKNLKKQVSSLKSRNKEGIHGHNNYDCVDEDDNDVAFRYGCKIRRMKGEKGRGRVSGRKK